MPSFKLLPIQEKILKDTRKRTIYYRPTRLFGRNTLWKLIREQLSISDKG